jgi:hypothetical protein
MAAGESRDGAGRTGKRRQDGQNITESQGSWNMTTEMGQRWQDSHDSKVGARYRGHDIGYDAGQDSRNRSFWTGGPDRSAWTSQAG